VPKKHLVTCLKKCGDQLKSLFMVLYSLLSPHSQISVRVSGACEPWEGVMKNHTVCLYERTQRH
jgi:hypothetical protein